MAGWTIVKQSEGPASAVPLLTKIQVHFVLASFC